MLKDLKSIYVQKDKKKEREHKDGFTIALSQRQLLVCVSCCLIPFPQKKIHLALISNERHEKGLTWKNVQSFKQNVRCVKFRMMRAVDFGALCIHDN